ncbi:MAG: glycosyltransferase family 2 protein [Candidatus Micrarchaeota archaeon]|nr:glycosyltransferase family 2 protein [Candidatus Micrarchaeota archaeon]
MVVAVLMNWNGIEVSYRKKPILSLCLSSLARTRYKNLKVVMVDPGSADNSIDYVLKNFKKVDVLREKDVSLDYETNQAIEYALKKYPGMRYVLWLNNDIIFNNRDWLQKMIDVAESDEGVGVVGCRLLYPDGKIQHAGMRAGIMPLNLGRGDADKSVYRRITEVESTTGAVMLIKREVIEKIGLLDEHLYGGFEDVDYCLRAKSAGFKVMYAGDAAAIHLEGFTDSRSGVSKSNSRFYREQFCYVYYAFRHFGALKRITIILIELGRSVVSVEGKGRKRGLSGIRIKDAPLWRIYASFKAIFKGYGLYRHYLTHKSVKYRPAVF